MSGVKPGSRTRPVNDHKTKLSGNLGVVQLVFTVLAFNGPLAAVVGFAPVVIGFGNGLGAPMAYVAAAVIVALFAAGFTKMARHIDNPGGFYSFVTAGLGRRAGLGASFVALVSYYLLLLGCYAFAGVAIGSLVADMLHGPDLPWWAWALVAQAGCGILGYLRLDISARFLTVFLAAEIVVIVLYDAFVLAKGGATGITGSSFLPGNIFSGSVGLGLLFAMFCMAGFEVTAIFRDEVRDPERTIPRSVYTFIACVALTYGATTWVVIQALGPADAVTTAAADPAGAFMTTMQRFVGVAGVHVVTVLLCTSLIAAVLATHNVLSRYLFNLGVDGILPRRLGVVHRRHGSPHRASLVTTALTLLGLLLLILCELPPDLLYAQLMGGFGYGFVLLLLGTCAAIPLYLSRTQLPGVTVFHRLVAPLLSFAGLAITLWLATSNLDLLITGGDGVIAALLIALYGSALAGVIAATIFKRIRPETYGRIGRQ